jgi:hypothetical protein
MAVYLVSPYKILLEESDLTMKGNIRQTMLQSVIFRPDPKASTSRAERHASIVFKSQKVIRGVVAKERRMSGVSFSDHSA